MPLQKTGATLRDFMCLFGTYSQVESGCSASIKVSIALQPCAAGWAAANPTFIRPQGPRVFSIWVLKTSQDPSTSVWACLPLDIGKPSKEGAEAIG